MVKEVELYIERQKVHHKKMTFMEEYAIFMKKIWIEDFKPLKRLKKLH